MSLGVKIEGMENLQALETLLRNVTNQARAARDAIVGLNNTNVAPPSTTTPNGQGNTPAGPSAVPVSPSVAVPPSPTVPRSSNVEPTDPKFIGPSPSLTLNEVRGSDLASEAAKKWAISVKKLSGELNKLAIGIGLVTTGVIIFIAKAVQATMEMANFGEATGLSTSRLQEFQHAAQISGASGKELLGLIESLQSKQAQIALGEGDLSPFAFFGIDPTQDTNAVLDELSRKIKTFSKDQLGVVREMASRMGISAQMFAAMRRSAEGISKAFVLSPESIESAQELNAAWQEMTFRLDSIRNQLVSAVAPAFKMVLGIVSAILKPIAVFLQWLNSGSTAANIARAALGALAVILGVIAAAILALIGIFTTFAVGVGIATAFTSGLAAAMGTLAAGVIGATWPILAIIAAIVALVFIINEIWVTLTGGQSYLRQFGESIGNFIGPINSVADAFRALGKVFIWAFDLMTPLGIIMNAMKVPEWLSNLFGGGDVAVNPLQQITQAAAQPPSNQAGNSSSSQNNDVTINVDGSKDPQATAKAVNGGLKQALSAAAYQMPVASF